MVVVSWGLVIHRKKLGITQSLVIKLWKKREKQRGKAYYFKTQKEVGVHYFFAWNTKYLTATLFFRSVPVKINLQYILLCPIAHPSKKSNLIYLAQTAFAPSCLDTLPCILLYIWCISHLGKLLLLLERKKKKALHYFVGFAMLFWRLP